MADTPNNITLLLTALVSGYQDIENMDQGLLLDRVIDTAVGVQLDMIGVIVGQLRRGLDDDTYRRYCRARIAANNSNGNSEDLIKVARLVLADTDPYIQLDPQIIATEVVRIPNDALSDVVANALLSFLQDAVAAGVRIITETQYVLDADQWFFAISAFAAGALTAGDIVILVNNTSAFPPSGTLTVDAGLAVQENVTYTGTTPTSFTGVSPLAHNHVSGTQISLATGPGKGMGDTGNLATGGQLARASDQAYTAVIVA